MRSLVLMSAVLAFVATSTYAANLTDRALVAQATAFLYHGNHNGLSDELGIHHGARVLIFQTCSDVCPVNTVRIVHYSIIRASECRAVGGRMASILVPVSITAVVKQFCIPGILFRRKLYVSRPYQHH